MQSKFYNKQKSPKRRFLLVLRFVVFTCIGLFIIFDAPNLNMAAWQCYAIAAIFIAYGIFRLVIGLKKDPDEEP